jgi:hypothetical protein
VLVTVPPGPAEGRPPGPPVVAPGTGVRELKGCFLRIWLTTATKTINKTTTPAIIIIFLKLVIDIQIEMVTKLFCFLKAYGIIINNSRTFRYN